jgi:hypothetical protein
MKVYGIYLNSLLLCLLVIGATSSSHGKVPDELTRDSKDNSEMLAAIREMTNGETCLESLYSSVVYKDLKTNNQGYSLGYTMQPSDFHTYSKDTLRSIEAYYGDSVYSQTCQ